MRYPPSGILSAYKAAENALSEEERLLGEFLGDHSLAALYRSSATRDAASSTLTGLELLRSRRESLQRGELIPDPRIEEAVEQFRSRRPYLRRLESVEPEAGLVVVYDPETGQRGEILPPPFFKKRPPPPFTPTYRVQWSPSLSEGERALRVLDRLLYGFDPEKNGSATARARLLSINPNLYREILRGNKPVSLGRVEEAVEVWNKSRPKNLPALKWRDGVPVPE